MKHHVRYLWGWLISIVALPFVLLHAGMALLGMFFLGVAQGIAYIIIHIYEGPFAPRPRKGENLTNPLSRLATWLVGGL